MSDRISIKINVPMMGYKKGDIVKLQTKNGLVRDSFWRKRIKDSVIDNCVEVLRGEVGNNE